MAAGTDRLDLVVTGGHVIDGTGSPPLAADVGVVGDRIAAVVEPGSLRPDGAEVLEADGLAVTPGFVDIHTHYDGQATWDWSLAPSAWHGVTTVVMGNCGVGFAPVRPTDHDALIQLMEGVEDIPGAALHEGVSFNWETFPEYLDALEGLDHDIDFAAQVPHGAVRLYVMGERGAAREPATAEEIAAMGRLVADGLQAGALGFTTSRTLNHRTSLGDYTPTLTAAEDELVGIARAMGEAGLGVVELVSDFPDGTAEFERFRHMVEASGRPLSISLSQQSHRHDFRGLLHLLDEAAADGLPMWAQVAPRPIGVLLGLQTTFNPFGLNPVYAELASLPLTDRVAALQDPEVRERLLAAETPDADKRYGSLWELGDPPDYEQPLDQTIAARAERQGRHPAELALDAVLQGDGTGMLYFPFANYLDGDFEAILTMLRHPRALVGLGDGGAHVGTICDGSNFTTMLTHWVRDRTRGEKLDVADVVHAITRRNAEAVGLCDRGVLAPGYKADLNVIDLDRLTLRPPEIRFDLPAGGRRLVQRAEGYRATVVSGQVISRDGEPTGARPGRLVRGAQPLPA